MRSQRTLRLLAALLSFSLVCATPARAGSVKFAEVEARTSAAGRRGRPTTGLPLRHLFQPGGTLTAFGGGEPAKQKTSGGAPGTTSSLLSISVGVPQGGRVETIELGEVNGTICDCGEISVPGGGFPRLPFLALAAVPLLFLGGRTSARNSVLAFTPIIPGVSLIPTPTPMPNPPPATPVPEPATLLLFGSGLLVFAAGARRRSRRRRTADGFAARAQEAS